MIHKIHNARTLLIAFSSAVLLAGQASAQTAPPAMPPAATPAPYKSAFDGYQTYSDDKMINWKAANDEVARIGGWRESVPNAAPQQIGVEGRNRRVAGQGRRRDVEQGGVIRKWPGPRNLAGPGTGVVGRRTLGRGEGSQQKR